MLASYEIVDLLVAYPGSSVELARDLGCFEHLITMYYDMISSVLRDGYRSTIPFPGLRPGPRIQSKADAEYMSVVAYTVCR